MLPPHYCTYIVYWCTQMYWQTRTNRKMNVLVISYEQVWQYLDWTTSSINLQSIRNNLIKFTVHRWKQSIFFNVLFYGSVVKVNHLEERQVLYYTRTSVGSIRNTYSKKNSNFFFWVFSIYTRILFKKLHYSPEYFALFYVYFCKYFFKL